MCKYNKIFFIFYLEVKLENVIGIVYVKKNKKKKIMVN